MNKDFFDRLGSIIIVIATIITAIATGVLAYYNHQYIKILSDERIERLAPAITVSSDLIIKYKDKDESIKILNELEESQRFIPLDRSDLFIVKYSVKNTGIASLTFSILDYDPDLYINGKAIDVPITKYADIELNKDLLLAAGEIKSFDVPYEMSKDLKNAFGDTRNKFVFKLQPRIEYKAIGMEKSFLLDVQFYCNLFTKDKTKLFSICNVRK